MKIKNWQKKPSALQPLNSPLSAFSSSSWCNNRSHSQKTVLGRGEVSRHWNCFCWLDKCCYSNSNYGSSNEKIDSRVWQKTVWQSNNSSAALAWDSAAFTAPSVYHILPGKFHAHKERRETPASYWKQREKSESHDLNTGFHLFFDSLIQGMLNWTPSQHQALY